MAGAIRETMRARLLLPAKALLVIARPKSPRLTASGTDLAKLGFVNERGAMFSASSVQSIVEA